jgi:hypothetical protein
MKMKNRLRFSGRFFAWIGMVSSTLQLSAQTHLPGNNPVLPGHYADPEILYSAKTKKYYLYPTSDGFKDWSGTFFKAFSSKDLRTWKDEGVILQLGKDVSWAGRNAWAPCIEEKKINGKYKYFYYFTAAQKIGVAVADSPTGPFVDSGKPLIDQRPQGINRGQVIDPDVFTDPQTGKSYLYWGNGFMACAELGDDMISIKQETLKILRPDNTFREGTYVFYRKGVYYFFWSENDTRSPDYRVRYATSTSPAGPLTIPADNIVIEKDTLAGIYGTGHNSVLQIPGKDEWYIVYHRFEYPNGINMGRDAGYNREVCIDRLAFNADGSIQKVKPTHQGIAKVKSGKAAVKKEPEYDGYLFAYFEGQGQKEKQEQLRFAVSADGVNWSALNDNQPVIPSEELSATGGIRDPYIMRSEDGKRFYAVATDMFTVKNGWDHNPGIVMLSSPDLINWKHGIIDLQKSYPQKFPNVKWVWAPQAIYDPAAGKYLVYFTVRLYDSPALDFYCAYANKDFTAFENEPKLMFKAKYGAIDGDIVYKDGLYHFFYKGNTKNEAGKEIMNGIQQATSTSLAGPWTEDFVYVDAYADKHISVEGSGIFKLNDGSGYILMYDMYRDHRYEFQRSADLFHFTQTPESFTKNFNPRHGTVMSITREEAQRLNKKWGGVPAALVNGGKEK